MIRVIGDRVRLDAKTKRLLVQASCGANIDFIRTVDQLNSFLRATMNLYPDIGAENKLMRYLLKSFLVAPTEINGNVVSLKSSLKICR